VVKIFLNIFDFELQAPMLGSDDEDKDLVPQPEAELDPAPDSVAAVMVFSRFNPILEPSLSPNLTKPNHAINTNHFQKVIHYLRLFTDNVGVIALGICFNSNEIH
jgi:hypothetical protein